VQERLQSLAAIHRALYQAPELSQVQFDELLSDLVGQLAALAPERMAGRPPELELDDVRLVPDQAAPLAMVAAEMITNALKYVDADAEGICRIGVKLAREEGDEGVDILLSVTNTASPGSTSERSDGLGRQLMAVLSQQLHGTLQSEVGDDSYTVRIRFPREKFQPEDD
jgi:two-component sensor histidine kinase